MAPWRRPPTQGFLFGAPFPDGPYAALPPDPRLSSDAQRLLDVLGVGLEEARPSMALARFLGLDDETRGVRVLADELLAHGYPVFAETYQGIYLVATDHERERALDLYRQQIAHLEARIAQLQESQLPRLTLT